jgi:serine O-acetyltransferase
VIPAHPGLLVSIFLRAQQSLVRRGHTKLAWQLRGLCNVITGADLIPGAEVGPGLYISHPVGMGIGANCRIGSNVTFGLGSACGGIQAYDHTDPTSTHVDDLCVIGDGVFLGARCFVLLGVTIGDRAVVGANSLVTKDVKPGAIVSGTPARFVAWRDGPPEAAAEAGAPGDAAKSTA